ncbi:chemotaxis protein CheW [Paenibacillus thermotolerans]|uniref:chemotaxis protein CheW n=1 Tax=Paenibacillus thermotolerans TaxID=3027807 RepID=UPI002367CFBB|nr:MULTISPECIES: chemotaxis protein CheW [unclassified Paenibacillus]
MQGNANEQYVEFGIENEQYAIRIEEINEIIKMQDVTQVPNVMPYVKGVINLRGKIVPIISLRSLFRLPEREYTKTTRIVVVRHKEEQIGIIVDYVNKVATFKDIQAPPERVGGIEGNFFVGLGLTDSGLVGILKLDEVLLHN